MKRRTLLAHGLAGALLCAATAVPVAFAEQTFEVGTVGGPSALMWPIYIGNQKGIFAADGMKVTVVYVKSNAGVQQQLAAGSLKVGISSGLVDPIRAVNEGAGLAIVRIEGQVPPYSLLAQPNIKSIKDLKGKTISVGGAKDITRTYFERMAAPNGIRPGQYDLVYAGSTAARFAALQSRSADAAILFPPFNFHAEDAGFNNLGLVVDYAKNLPFSGTVVNRAWASSHKAELEKYLADFTKAIAWFNDPKNREEAIKMMVDESHQSRPDVEKSYDFYRKIHYFEPTGKVSKAKIAEVITVLQKEGDIGKSFDENKLFMSGVTQITQ